MRMLHYFAALAALVVPALLATAGIGIFGEKALHLKVGLVTAIFTVGMHTLLILFMIVTGRVLKEAIKSRDLPRDFLDELNRFFAERAAYPAAVFAALLIVFAGVLGYGAPALGMSPAVHMLTGVFALAFNLWAIPIEFKALRANQDLLDKAAAALDDIDRELEARGELPEEERYLDPRTLARGGLIVAISAWFPYLYWALIVWRGDFSKVSVHPFLEVSAVSLFIWFLAVREPVASAGD